MVQISDRDKVMAAAVNVSSIFFPYAGPAVGAIVGAKNPYVKFHAYRCLISQIVTSVIIGTLMILSLCWSIYSLYQTYQRNGNHFDLASIDWVTLIIKTGATWLLLGLWNVINIILAIRDAMQALAGKMPLKPKWVERKALSWSGMNRPTTQAIPSSPAVIAQQSIPVVDSD